MSTKVNFQDLYIQAGQVFNPNTPVSEKDLFSGRTSQISRVLDVVFQKGQHVMIFGERGVGKSSLANVLSSFVPNGQKNYLTVRVNGDKNDSFASAWKKVFEEISLVSTVNRVGYNATSKQVPVSGMQFLPTGGTISPNDIKNALSRLSEIAVPIIIIDEFDRLPEEERKVFADLVKTLSDYSLEATVILIGVGESVEQIIKEHQSVSRALVQVQMPRMTMDEIKNIISLSLTRLNMTIDKEALNQIALLSKGLPHYAHLVGLHATRDALDNENLKVSKANVKEAIRKSIEDAQHFIKTSFHQAITSSRPANLFSDVLLACALANVNELGEFAAQDIRTPINKITGKSYDIPAFAQHLNDFSSATRGNILIKTGVQRRYRYKFADPLMQPYTIMQGIMSKKIDSDDIV